MKKSVKILTAAAVAAALALGGVTGGFLWYRSHRDSLPPAGENVRDLRDQELTVEQYEAARADTPDEEILWNVPFQKRHYASNVKKITITSLSEEDVERLQYLPELSEVDATNCFDYHALALLRKEKPDCRLTYSVVLGDQFLDMDAETVFFASREENFEELMHRLEALPNMKTVSFTEPNLTAEELKILQDTYPEIHFQWTMKLFDREISSDLEELDISGMKFENIQEVEQQTEYIPGLKKLIMCNSGLPCEDIADYRERSRSRFKVIFNVPVGKFDLRTDATWFKPYKLGGEVKDCDTRYLKYCEDLIAVDLSNNQVKNLDWVRGTPHLKYLIVQRSPLKDIQPLRYLKELKLLEIYQLDVRNLKPVLDCTALEDLHVVCPAADMAPLAEMTWLKTAWISASDTELPDIWKMQKQLKNTKVIIGGHEKHWHDLPNYQDMLAVMQQPIPLLNK